jgi:hypothetical protein
MKDTPGYQQNASAYASELARPPLPLRGDLIGTIARHMKAEQLRDERDRIQSETHRESFQETHHRFMSSFG